MSRIKKGIFIFIDLIMLSLILLILWENFNAMNFPWQIKEVTQVSDFGQYVPQYIFVFCSALALVLFVSLIIFCFMPKTYLSIILDDKMGHLVLKRSAIEGLVRENITELGYIRQPSIKIKLFKKKVKVLIKGEILPREEAVERIEKISHSLQSDLQNFFGINHKLIAQVKVRGLAPKKDSSSIRVE